MGNSRGILVSRRPPDQGAEKDSSIQGVSENGSFHTPGGGSSCGSDRGVMNLNSADPIKAMVFVHRANRELLQDIYGTNQDAKIPKISYRYLANVDITTLTGDHSVTDYDEMVRLHQEGILYIYIYIYKVEKSSRIKQNLNWLIMSDHSSYMARI